MEIKEIVMKLIGPVQPVGESAIDAERLKNIRNLTVVIDSLLDEIKDASLEASRVEDSMRLIGTHAKSFLNYLKEEM